MTLFIILYLLYFLIDLHGDEGGAGERGYFLEFCDYIFVQKFLDNVDN